MLAYFDFFKKIFRYLFICNTNNKLAVVNNNISHFSLNSEHVYLMYSINFRYVYSVQQGIINMNKKGNSANFFSYVCNGKKIKELFASTFNKKPASVKCVSTMMVVLNAKFARLLAALVN